MLSLLWMVYGNSVTNGASIAMSTALEQTFVDVGAQNG